MDPRKRSKPKDIPVIKTNHISKIAEEEKPIKAGSSFDIPLAIGHRDELFVDDLPRRRSNSAPLTLEATGLANKLRLASDSFQSAYEKGSKMKKRRATVHRMDVKRRSWPAWNPQIEEEQEEDAVFHYSSSLPSNGTTV